VPARDKLVFVKFVGAIKRDQRSSNGPTELEPARKFSFDCFQLLLYILERLETLGGEIVQRIPFLDNPRLSGSVHGEVRCNM